MTYICETQVRILKHFDNSTWCYWRSEIFAQNMMDLKNTFQ